MSPAGPRTAPTDRATSGDVPSLGAGPRTPLWLSGMRSRPLVSALLLALVAVAVATATLGPLLTRSLQQATLQQVLGAAAPGEASVAVTSTVGDARSSTALARAYGEQRGRLADLLQSALVQSGSTVWRPPEVSLASTTNVTWRVGTTASGASRVDALDLGGCAGLTVTRGRCPAEVGEVLVSVADARGFGVGATLVVPGQAGRLHVTGLYDPDASDHGQLVRRSSEAGAVAGVSADPLVVTDAQAAAMLLSAEVTGRLRLGPAVRLDDEPGLRRGVDAVTTLVGEQQDVLRIDTQLPRLLDRADSQTAAAVVLVAVTTVQALLLALVAVSVVLQRLARARAPEWGVGRLRGLGRTRWLASVYAEPALVLLLGLPLGHLLGVATARAAVRIQLAPGTPVEPWRWPVGVAAATTTVAALGSLVVVSLRTVRRPLSEVLSQASEPRRLTPLGAVLQAVVVLLAATTVYELLAGGLLGSSGSQLGLLAPALLALAVAVVAVRATVLVVRRVTARPPRHLVALVVGRSSARRPSTLNPAVVVAAGLALAVFAVQVLVVSTRNQDLRAAAVVGAAEVLHVSVPAGVDLRGAVDRADPGGRFAMAVQERAGSGTGGSGRIVAVDSSRLLAVTAVRAAWLGGEEAVRRLRPGVAPLVLRGTALAVTLSGVSVTTGGIDDSGEFAARRDVPPPALQLVLDAGGRWVTLPLGDLRTTGAGRRVTVRTTVPCTSSCRVVGLGLTSGPGSGYRAALTLTSLRTDRTPDADTAPWLHETGRWAERVGQNTSATVDHRAFVAAGSAGLTTRFEDDRGGRATSVGPTDVADPLPAVAAPGLPLVPLPGIRDTAEGTGLDGRPQLVQVVARADVLPRALGDGVLVDLDDARGLSDPASSETVDEVWLAAGSPPAVEQSLTSQGVRVESRERLVEERQHLHQEASTRAASVGVWIAAATLLLSLLCLAAARVADMGRRRRDWRSLGQAGLPRTLLRRLVFVEVAGPALLATVVGTLSGSVAAALALRRLPLVDLSLPGPPLELRLAWPATALVAASMAVAVLVVAAAAALTEIGRER